MCWQCSPGCQGWNQLHYQPDNYQALFNSHGNASIPLVQEQPACVSKDSRRGTQLNSYDEKGHVLRTQLRGRLHSEYTWNQDGSKASETLHYPDGTHATALHYDDEGRLIERDRQTPNNRFIERYEYDDEGRVRRESVGNSPETVRPMIERTYGQGQQLLTEDRRVDEGNWHHKRWDAKGRIIEIRGQETSAGIKTWQGDVHFRYDQRGRITERLEDGMVTQSVRYQDSEKGELQHIVWTRQDGYETEWSFDAGLLRKKRRLVPFPNGSGTLLFQEDTFDPHGRLTESKKLTGALEANMDAATPLRYEMMRYRYGPFGLVESRRTSPGSTLKRAHWRYDQAGHLLESNEPNNLSVHQYSYDGLGRLLEQKSQFGAGLASSEKKRYAWDRKGRATNNGMTYQNGYPWARGSSEDYSCHLERFANMPRRGFQEKKPATPPSPQEQIECLVTRTPPVHFQACEEYPSTRPNKTVLHPIQHWSQLGQRLPVDAL